MPGRGRPGGGAAPASSALCALALLALACASDEPPGATRPNFLVIVIDDLGWADVGYQGGDLVETPHIDRLAGQGRVFRQGYAAAPLCSPSRAALLTGRSPARLHLTSAIVAASNDQPARRRSAPPFRRLLEPGIRDHLPLAEVTVAEVLAGAGYATGFIGKWHLAHARHGRRFGPRHQGFGSVRGAGPQLRPAAYTPPYGIPDLDREPGSAPLPERLAEEAVRFLEAHREGPFLLLLWHYAVHSPWQAPESEVAAFRERMRPGQSHRNPVHAAMVHGVDRAVGRVLAALDDLGLAEQTVVFLTADNGGLLQQTGEPGQSPDAGRPVTSNAPLRGGKAMIYEGGIRVPLLVRAPGLTEPGTRSDVPVIGTDLFPTLLDLAGVTPDPARPLDGESLRPLLSGRGALSRDALTWHFPHYIKGFRPWPERETWWNTPASAIRSGDWKLIDFYEGAVELYDLSVDVGEAHDVADLQPQRRAALHERLRRELRSQGARLPAPNPRFDPGHPRAAAWPLQSREVPVSGAP